MTNESFHLASALAESRNREAYIAQLKVLVRFMQQVIRETPGGTATMGRLAMARPDILAMLAAEKGRDAL